MNSVQPSTNIRDESLYSTRYTKQGALVEETRRLFRQLSTGRSIDALRDDVLCGSVISQKSRNTRRHIWSAFTCRFLTAVPQWALRDLISAGEEHNASTLLSLNYLYFCLRDRFTFDLVTELIWTNAGNSSYTLDQHNVMSFLDQASEAQQQIARWSSRTRSKLASMVLSALTQFGVLEGTRRKRVRIPDLPPSTIRHVLRLLTWRGVSSRELLEAPEWRVFLRTQESLLNLLRTSNQAVGISVERTGDVVVIETPQEWRDFSALI
jgi:hypothetical protein